MYGTLLYSLCADLLQDRLGVCVVQEVVRGVLGKATRVLVTHQLQFLPEADIVVKMEHGRIVATGTYAELVKQGVELSELKLTQTGEYPLGLFDSRSPCLQFDQFLCSVVRSFCGINWLFNVKQRLACLFSPGLIWL